MSDCGVTTSEIPFPALTRSEARSPWARWSPMERFPSEIPR